MAKSIKISDEEMALVRQEAALASRSIAGQVTHWMRIGRTIERAPEFNYAHIREALEGRRSPDALTGEEQVLYIDDLLSTTAGETPEQAVLFQARREAGRGVGSGPNGEIVKQTATSKPKAAAKM
jgi:hypothetical protein